MVSSKLTEVFSEIRGELYYRALEKEKEGAEILKLNTGNPAAFGFSMADSVKNAVLSKLDKALGYCDIRGMAESRQAICDYHTSLGAEGITPDDIYITNGVSEAAYLAVTALCNEGDEFLVPTPCYSLWVNLITLAGGRVVFYTCDELADWMPDAANIESKITPKTKAILLINPNNPTGAVYDKEIVYAIYRLAQKHSLAILSDEIYDRLVFDGRVHTPTASLGKDVAVLSFNGLSKSHCLCGFRCGWLAVSGPETVKREWNTALSTLSSIRLCSNAIMQLVIPEALEDVEYTRSMIAEGGRLYNQRKAACEELDAIDGMEYVANKAAFYIFPKINMKQWGFANDKQFAKQLLEKKNILVVAGSGFYCADNEHFRMVTLPEEPLLRRAIREIGNCIRQNK